MGTEYEMKCPKCKTNRWKLSYEGDSTKGICDKTENVRTCVGCYGRVIAKCRKCGWEHTISVGSD